MFLGYPTATYYAITYRRLGLALGVLLGLIISLALNFFQTKVIAWFIVAIVAIFLLALPEVQLVYLFYLPPLVINLVLAWLFGRTLYTKKLFPYEPLISYFARLEGNLTPEIERYTYLLTWIWTIFFILMAFTSAFLALFGSLAAWSLFTSVINYVLAALLFVVEYTYRRVRYPQYRFLAPWELMRRVKNSIPSKC